MARSRDLRRRIGRLEAARREEAVDYLDDGNHVVIDGVHHPVLNLLSAAEREEFMDCICDFAPFISSANLEDLSTDVRDSIVRAISLQEQADRRAMNLKDPPRSG